MMGVSYFFSLFEFGYFGHSFDLTYAEVTHPNSVRNNQFKETALSLGICPPEISASPTFDSELIANHYVIVLLGNITNGLENLSYHAVVIYALENENYKIKDSLGKKYEIPKKRCTFMQVKL